MNSTFSFKAKTLGTLLTYISETSIFHEFKYNFSDLEFSYNITAIKYRFYVD